MQLHSLPDIDGSRCLLVYEENNQWLRATWRGYVDPEEAMRGATSYLARVGELRCPYLLNDNAALQGPWFDTVDWLKHAWLPHAVRLGLRYVAHVVQADTHTDVLTLTLPHVSVGAIELQVFEQVSEAEDWLRSCQRQHVELAVKP